MAHNALLAGGLLMLIVLVLAHLQPAELLHPSRRTQLAAGLAGGVVSALVLAVLRLNAPELGVAAYPTATAFMGLYFGGLASVVTAAVAMAAVLWLDDSAGWAAHLVLAGAGALGALWRRMDQRPGVNPWAVMTGMALTLPPVVALCLVASGEAPLPQATAGWVQQLPWYHGMGILVLGAGRQLLASLSVRW